MSGVIVCTSTGTMPDGRPSGTYASELVEAWEELTGAGLDPIIASPRGGPVPVEARRSGHPGEEAFFGGRGGARAASSERLDELSPGTGLVLVVGGHSAVLDLAESQPLADLVTGTWRMGGVVAAVCHGVAGLLRATDDDGQPLVSGRQVTAFSVEEEAAVGMLHRVPWLLTEQLEGRGAHVRVGPAFLPHHVVDSRLVTGQNPASTRATAKAATGLLATTRTARAPGMAGAGPGSAGRRRG